MLRLHFRGNAVGFCAGLLVFGLLPQAMNAQADRAAHVRGLNNDLLRLHSEVSQNPPGQAATKRVQAAQVIGQRADALSNLIQRDPAQALSLAFSREALADLRAAFPDATSQLESHRTLRGSVERWVAESADLRASTTVTHLRSGGQALSLYFVGPEPVGLTSGSILEATGVQVGTAMAVSSSTLVSPTVLTSSGGMSPLGAASTNSATTITTGLSCSTTGVQKTAVILATWAGATVPPAVTPQSVYDTFFGTGGHSLDGYLQEASYGQTSAAGDVFGWYTLSQPYACGQGDQILNEAMAMAAAQGVNFQNYTRIFIVYPNIGCTAGSASLGCFTLSTPSGSITASTAGIEADYLVGDQGVQLAAHEAGHNLGLQHAGTLNFGTEALGPLGAAGTVNEFGDEWSVMGSYNLGQYSAQHKAEILNWLAPTTNYQVVQSSGTWSLQPFETGPAGLQALKIQRGAGNNAWLWVEYRQPIGNYDSTVYFQQPSGGAFIHYEDSTTGLFTHLLDFTPGDGSWYNPALTAGNTWVDAYTGLSISLQSATASALTVNVTYGPTPCAHANPTVSASPLNPSSSPGKSVGYSVVVTNNDSAGCSAGNFSLASNQPSGWATAFSATTLTLSPGQSGTVTMTKNIPASVIAGMYAVDTTAADNTNTGSGLANVTVTVPPAVTVGVSTASLTYAVKQTASVTATVLYGATPAAGANVKFTMTQPGGSTSTKTITTDSSGRAVWSYKIGARGPLGTYSITASTTFNSLTASASPAAFTVQ